MTPERFLVTGAAGCIGAWVLRNLAREGADVIASDLSADLSRPRLLMDAGAIDRLTFLPLDVTDAVAVRAAVSERGVTRIVHLASLQVPFCRADPTRGSMVNVVGTVNVFEAARAAWGQVRGLSYASSVAVLGPARCYPVAPVEDDAAVQPQTIYGVYKEANEGLARVYWQDWQIPSVGLRPYIVYGVARDQGTTSDITKALLAVAAGRPYHIKFGGLVALQHAADVARMFIACARSDHRGAAACNLRNDVVEVSDFVARLERNHGAVGITWEQDRPLPYPGDLGDRGLRSILAEPPHTPLDRAIAETIEAFRLLIKRGEIDCRQLDS